MTTDSDEPTGGVAGWAADLMDAMGAPGAGIAIALENLFPPMPSEIILPLAGFAASQNRMGLFAVIVWTTLGSVMGAMLLYGLGAWLGRDRLIAIADWMPLIKVSDVEVAEAWFAKHGTKAIFFGRMVPIVRSLISIPSGVERIRLPLFMLLSAGGSLIWNTGLVLAGYALGNHWEQVEEVVSPYSRVVLVLCVLAVVAFIAFRIRSNRRGPRGAHSPPG